MWRGRRTEGLSANTFHTGSLVRQLTLAPARRGHLVLAIAAAALSIGYADLIRGGITVGPVLIVVGYAVLVPAAILMWK